LPVAFLDTNVFLRHLLQDHQNQSLRATAYFAQIEGGEIQVQISDTVIFETVFTLERTYKQSKRRIREILLPLIDLPGIVLPSKGRMRQAFDFYVDKNISFADALHASVALSFNLKEIVTFDRGFNRVPGIRRVEP